MYLNKIVQIYFVYISYKWTVFVHVWDRKKIIWRCLASTQAAKSKVCLSFCGLPLDLKTTTFFLYSSYLDHQCWHHGTDGLIKTTEWYASESISWRHTGRFWMVAQEIFIFLIFHELAAFIKSLYKYVMAGWVAAWGVSSTVIHNKTHNNIREHYLMFPFWPL